MVSTCTYTTISGVYSFGNISSNTITSGMVQECIDRAGFRVNEDLGAETSGSDYVEFQSSNSAGLSYVPANTLSLIKTAHAHLTNAYTLTFEYAPDMDQWSEVNGAMVKYRADVKNESRKKYYFAEYARIVDLLQKTDREDDYFNKHRNRARKIVMCEPDDIDLPPGNPL